ncbi:putative sodium-dependent multivitamin transporter [Sipha flava]|uniref:Sodium-dependent multivitamin transporter n=3 Tax=Sipha flava TaxID=143950 RepID=A0A8B8FUJ9_9HEMI|nr:putative sodium-dependent multivitamin transporter [Sipha flava]XP_025414482.1 putative sodium-dependent multivitamin transporter [Sipha flava]
MALAVFDYVVLAVALLASAAIGLYYRLTGGKQQTVQEYMLGDRKLTIIPVGFSLMASFMCTTSMFGLCAENYLRGTQFMVINASNIIGTPIVAYVFLPVFYKLGYLSVYKYLEERFGKSTRTVASVAFSVQTILRTALVLYAASLALTAITGVSQTLSMTTVGVLCTFYSAIGGIKAVIVTDLFQSLLMFASVFTVIEVAAVEVGGLSEIWRIAYDRGRVEFFNFQMDPTVRHTWWSLTLGGAFTYVSVYGTNQVQVQRYLTMKDYGTVVRTLWFSWPITAFLSLCMCFAGLAVFTKYRDCDPIKAGRIATGDQLMPLFVLDAMGRTAGLTGLFLAGVCSSALCSVSAALNSLAAVTLEDYVTPLINFDIPDRRRVIWLKVLVIGYGALSIALAFCAHFVGPLLQASMTILGITGGPITAVFTLGILVPYVNQKGCLMGLVVGLLFSFVLGLGGPKPPVKDLPTYVNGCLPNSFNDFYYSSMATTTVVPEESYMYLFRISYMYFIVIGFMITLVVTLVASLFFESNVNNLDSKLFFAFVSDEIERKNIERRKKYSTTSKTVTFAIDC